MKDRFKVCIKEGAWRLCINPSITCDGPKKGEIVEVMKEGKGEKGLLMYTLKGYYKNRFSAVEFRDIDNSLGEWVEETIMKEVVYEEALTQK